MADNTIGWGQGSVNNGNGWGAGASNNGIDWGEIHSQSYGHDETNLTGDGVVNPFTDASLAYSLRDLGLGNITNVVRVRRSSDNTEQDFTPTQITDGTLTTFCGVGDGFVTTWYDQSATGNNATQTTAITQPTIVESGVLITENSLPSIKYDGTKTLQLTATTSNNFYITLNALDGDFIFGESSASRVRYRAGLVPPSLQYNVAGATPLWEFAGGVKDGVLALINADSFKNLGYNNNTQPDNTPLTIPTFNIDALGGEALSPTLVGQISEFIIFDTDISNDADVRSNIINYYTLT